MCSSGSISKLSENCTIRKSSSLDSSKYLQLKHFQYISTLGEGSFGKVILVRKKSNQTLYAIKLINTDKLSDLRRLEYTRFERHVLAEFQNPLLLNYAIYLRVQANCVLFWTLCREEVWLFISTN